LLFKTSFVISGERSGYPLNAEWPFNCVYPLLLKR